MVTIRWMRAADLVVGGALCGWCERGGSVAGGGRLHLGCKKPGSREAERAPGDPGADPLNLIRVIPAKGAMRKSIPEERALREAIPGCSSCLPFRAPIATEGGYA